MATEVASKRDSHGISANDVRSKPVVIVPESYQIVVECRNEDDQRVVYERMTGEGYRCRVITL